MNKRRLCLSTLEACLYSLLISCPSTGATGDIIDSPITEHVAPIFMVFAIDTEPGRFSPWQHSPKINFAPFADTGRFAHIIPVMDSAWRGQYRDVHNRIPKFTWFVMSHQVLRLADGCTCAGVYDSLMKFADNIEDFGDEIGWHYHHACWSDPDADDIYAWNQITTFDGTVYANGTDIEIAERELGCLIAKTGIFPTAFRSGWVWENNRFSKWLERIFPFDFSANPGNAEPRRRIEPVRNVYDWSRAPKSYAGYHPHYKNYQRIGNMRRWIFRTVSPNTPHEWNRIFLAAKSGAPQMFCFTCHSFDNIRKNIDSFLTDFLQAADSSGIPICFATASEAGAALCQHSDLPRPMISLVYDDSTVSIETEGALFQPYPYCVAHTSRDEYLRIVPLTDGPDRWRIVIRDRAIKTITCAVSTLSGKSAAASVAIP